MMVDEIAELLQIDPIELRLRNVLTSGAKNTQGAIAAGALRADEVLERARRHPLWTERAKRKTAYEASHPGQRYGVGFACVQRTSARAAKRPSPASRYRPRAACCCTTLAPRSARAWAPRRPSCACNGSASPPTSCRPPA